MKTILKTICIIIIFYTPSTLFAQKDTMVFIVDTKAPYVEYINYTKLKKTEYPHRFLEEEKLNFYIGIESNYIEDLKIADVDFDAVIHLFSYRNINNGISKLKISKSKLGQYILYTSENLNKFNTLEQCRQIDAVVYRPKRITYVAFKEDLINEYINLYSVEVSCNYAEEEVD